MPFKPTHGFSKTKFYRVYTSLKSRSGRIHGYEHVKCEWNNFEDFKKDMYIGYLKHVDIYGREETSIDRINGKGNYCKDNCRWATRREQLINRKSTLWYKGKLLKEVCEEIGLKYNTVIYRMKRGNSMEESLKPLP